MPRRTREEAREEIIEGAMRFLAVRPYRELTIPALMAQTSVERTSFYTSFPSIPALVKEILGRVSAELRTAGWTNYFTLDGDPREQMRQAIDAAIEVWSRHGPMLRAISEAAPLDHELEELWVGEVLASAVRASARRLRKEQRRGAAAKGDPDELALAVNRMIVVYLNERLGRPGNVDRKVIARTLETIIIGGLYQREAADGA